MKPLSGLADIENRARADLSDLERAKNYRWALQAHYGGVQARMAERLNLSKGWLSKLLTMSALPDAIIAAFVDPTALTVRGGYELAVKATGAEAGALLAEARVITDEQRQRRVDGLNPIDTPTVLRRLLASGIARVGNKGEAILVGAADGRAALTLQSRRGRILTLRLDLDAKVDRTALLEGFCSALDTSAP